MAAGADVSPPFTLVEGGYSNDNMSAIQDEISQNSDNVKHMSSGKPPRHLSVVRHCISSATLVAATDSVSKFFTSGTYF